MRVRRMVMIAKIAHSNPLDLTPIDREMFVYSCGYYRVNDDTLLSCHREHGNNFHINYIQHGKSAFVVNGEEYIASEGDVIFYNVGDQHHYTHLTDHDTQIYWIHFEGDKAKELLAELGINESCVLHTNTNLAEYFENIIRELTHQNDNYNKIATGNLNIILSKILRKSSDSDEEINYIISLMNSMENNRMTLEEYANICHLSKSQFIRRFRDYTGQTPINYKNKIIVRNAQWYIENSNYSISEIANILQFENVYYFSSMFKKTVGISPIRWREKLSTI